MVIIIFHALNGQWNTLKHKVIPSAWVKTQRRSSTTKQHSTQLLFIRSLDVAIHRKHWDISDDDMSNRKNKKNHLSVQQQLEFRNSNHKTKVLLHETKYCFLKRKFCFLKQKFCFKKRKFCFKKRKFCFRKRKFCFRKRKFCFKKRKFCFRKRKFFSENETFVSEKQSLFYRT